MFVSTSYGMQNSGTKMIEKECSKHVGSSDKGTECHYYCMHFSVPGHANVCSQIVFEADPLFGFY